MKKVLIVTAALWMLAAPGWAETLKGDYPACISEELFDEFISAAVKNDTRHIEWLLQNGCIITKPGIQVSVLDWGWGTSKIRAYAGGESVVLWTNSENIQR